MIFIGKFHNYCERVNYRTNKIYSFELELELSEFLGTRNFCSCLKHSKKIQNVSFPQKNLASDLD